MRASGAIGLGLGGNGRRMGDGRWAAVKTESTAGESVEQHCTVTSTGQGVSGMRDAEIHWEKNSTGSVTGEA